MELAGPLQFTFAALAIIGTAIFWMSRRTDAQRRCENVTYADADWPEVEIDESRQESVGKIVGAHAGVNVYSCGYNLASVPRLLWSGITSKTEEGHYCGLKWQCVELARRYMIKTRQLTFESVGMAYEIFDLDQVHKVTGPGADVARSVVRTCQPWRCRGMESCAI